MNIILNIHRNMTSILNIIKKPEYNFEQNKIHEKTVKTGKNPKLKFLRQDKSAFFIKK